MNEAAVIMAAGMGKRMGGDLPKVCYRVADRPLVQWVVDACRAAGIERIVAIVGYRQDLVREALAGQGIEFAVQAEQKGTGHAALQARQVLGDAEVRMFVLNGDMPLIDAAALAAMRAAHVDQQADMTLTSTIPPEPLEYGRVLHDADGHVMRVVEERDCTPEQHAVRELNVGFYVFNAPAVWPVFESLRDTNAQGELYITDMAQAYYEQGKRVVSVQVSPEVGIGVNTRDQLVAIDAMLRAKHGL